MLNIGYVPSGFGQGLIIPIPKSSNVSNSRSSKTKDYRGITISPVMSTNFESCILKLFHEFFVSSDFQFGFKKGKGCRDALFTLSETVNYFVCNNSTVNICAVDLSRAFDEIKHDVLFDKLMQKKFPVCIVSTLHDWYSKCFCLVKWGSSFSRLFEISQGVTQGGVLSPLFFAIYVNDVLCKLNTSSMGCYVCGLMISAIMYADDVILLAPSVEVLQKLITLCQSEFETINLKFNVTKCAAMRIGSRYKSDCFTLEALDGSPIPWVSEMRYLGVMLAQSPYLKVNVHFNKVKFFKSFNNIYAKLGSQNRVDTLIHLLKTHCLSVLMYNLESLHLTKTNLNDLQFPINRAYIKIFHVNVTSSISSCQFYTQQLPVDMLCELNKMMYWNKLTKTDSKLFDHLFSCFVKPRKTLLNKKYGFRGNENLPRHVLSNVMFEQMFVNLNAIATY